jgi:uncharacterized cupredoxin-like copper-binding protein
MAARFDAMRGVLLAICVVAALAVAGAAVGGSRTTNVPAIFTVKITLSDAKIAMTPNHAVRGSTITFVLINRGRKTHTFVIGDPKRGAGHGQGFAQVLKPNQQFQKVMFLDYRGLMKVFSRTGATVVARNTFTIR